MNSLEVHVIRLGGDGPAGVRAWLGTENANGTPSADFESRRGRCYELAGYAAVFGGIAPPDVRLVHGSWQGGDAPERIGHAWLEVPTPKGLMIWEPIQAGLYDAEKFRAFARAWDEVTYTVPSVRRLLAEHGHYGRWHESRYP